MQHLDFVFVPPTSLNWWWPQVEKMMKECPETWEPYMDLSDIYDELLMGQMTLALVLRKTEVVFSIMLTVQDFEKCRALVGVWASGTELETVAPLAVEKIKDWAREIGASEFRMENSRKGWTKFMAKFGFEEIRTVIATKIEPRAIH